MSLHSCSYYCDRPECIKAQRDELVKKLEPADDSAAYHGWVLREVLFDNGEPVGHREPQPTFGWVGFSEEERYYYSKMGLVGVEIIEAKLKSRNT